jgi:4-hydroxyphenylpyruvate dioxygenase-like putative hemolysin
MTEATRKPDYRLDHVCLAVRKIAPARAMLERTLGYSARTDPVTNTRQQVTVQFMHKAESIDIKLIEPSSSDSPLVEFIKSRGGGLHHLAFRTLSVSEGAADLTSNGGKLLAGPEPGEAFCDSPIAFVFVGSGLNVELIETDCRRDERDD